MIILKSSFTESEVLDANGACGCDNEYSSCGCDDSWESCGCDDRCGCDD